MGGNEERKEKKYEKGFLERSIRTLIISKEFIKGSLVRFYLFLRRIRREQGKYLNFLK